ncbi:DUF2975 domain-containing protein, partial [Streptomyces mirabilis]
RSSRPWGRGGAPRTRAAGGVLWGGGGGGRGGRGRRPGAGGAPPLTPLRVITILGIGTAQVALVCVWRLVTMVRRGTVFSHAAFRYVDGIIGAIVAAALVWFAVTAVNAPGQRDDPGVTLIMGGIGVAILGVALIVLVLRMLLAQAVARDVEAAQMQAELDEVI